MAPSIHPKAELKTHTLNAGAAMPSADERLMVARRAEATSIGNGLTSRALGFAGTCKGDMAPLFVASESELPLLSPLCIVVA